jgi:hypothetical protein
VDAHVSLAAAAGVLQQTDLRALNAHPEEPRSGDFN